tara:strand:+ start:1277 stop:1516 length:240 start_codon:yes stop_codon:yes gene_type:complete
MKLSHFSFTKHPNDNKMSYFKHMFHSLHFAVMLFVASIKAVIHAIFPFFFETSTTDVVKKINKMIKKMKYPNRRVRFNV